MGLNMGHAYSLLDLRTVKCKVKGKETNVRLLKLRNPWGFGKYPDPIVEASIKILNFKDRVYGHFALFRAVH